MNNFHTKMMLVKKAHILFIDKVESAVNIFFVFLPA